MASQAVGPSSAQPSAQNSEDARDSKRSAREQFDRFYKQELVIQSAAMPKDELPSCTALFDKCLQCFALFPQFRHVYRHGHFSDCADKVDDFKACLTLRGLDADEKYRAWIERRAELAARKRLSKQSVEEFWTIRTGRDGRVIDEEFESPEFPDGHNATKSDSQDRR
ncbi:hypothetical protein OC845_000656 [Tilletia horrida]|nr:hypothetical protein OC845_000656 [Tilletia horrida]